MESTPIIDTKESPVDQHSMEPLYTPVSYSSKSRKRKVMQAARKMKYLTINEPEPSPVPYYMSPDENYSSAVLTSTMNESRNMPNFASDLSGTFGANTSNISQQNFQEGNACKRQRISSTFSDSKSLSAPSTPTRERYDSTSYNAPHSCNFTPTKKYFPRKIETPERFKILYPQLKEVRTPSKPKTPQKFRESILNVTPVKKRLFAHDPLEYFCVLSKHVEIVHKIFGYLRVEDLEQVQNVSTLWKKLLAEDRKSKGRLNEYIKIKQREKENFMKTLDVNIEKSNVESMSFENGSPPPSPNSINYVRYKKAAEKLDPSKDLAKCLKCSRPAVKQGFICQCINGNCGYIWCEYCLSSSASGPENFTDRCAKSELSLSPLSNLSNIEGTPSFLLNSPGKSSYTLDSSGYFSTSDVNLTGKGKALKDHNNAPRKVRTATLDVTPILSVRALTPKRRSPELRDGSVSPKPKAHKAACSCKKCHKKLRRLFY